MGQGWLVSWMQFFSQTYVDELFIESGFEWKFRTQIRKRLRFQVTCCNKRHVLCIGLLIFVHPFIWQGHDFIICGHSWVDVFFSRTFVIFLDTYRLKRTAPPASGEYPYIFHPSDWASHGFLFASIRTVVPWDSKSKYVGVGLDMWMSSSSKSIYDKCVLYIMSIHIYIYVLGGGFKHACITFTSPFGVGRCPNYLTHACLFQTNHFQNQRLLNAMWSTSKWVVKGGLVWGESAERCLTELLQAGSGWFKQTNPHIGHRFRTHVGYYCMMYGSKSFLWRLGCFT